MLDRSLAASVSVAAVATWVPVAAASSHAPPGSLERLARRLDGAVSAAPWRRRDAAIAAVTLPGATRAVVVRRDATLAAVRAAAPRDVVRERGGVWLVRATIVVADGATLTVAAPAVRELRLASGPDAFASLVARDASLRFRGQRVRRLRVRSWNAALAAPDAVLEDGRASVSVRRRGRLDAADTEFSSLGFAEGRVSGVAVVSPRGVAARPSGRVVRSSFGANWFGAYTYRARGMTWSGNRFVGNAIYGFDPHDASSRFVVTGNLARANGRHGIIFSRSCRDNVIAGNTSADNGWHGIVVDDGRLGDGPSTGNLVVRNVVRGNRGVGISIDGSGDNVIRGNRTVGQRDGIRLTRAARANVVVANSILLPSRTGIALAGGASVPTDTRIAGNAIRGAPVGVRLRDTRGTILSGNLIEGARGHAVMIYGGGASGTRLIRNTVEGRGASPVWVTPALESAVQSSGTRARWDYPLSNDVARAASTFVGPALWAALIAVALGGGAVMRTAARLRALPGRTR
jgi:parallel beta-helix repeat protein